MKIVLIVVGLFVAIAVVSGVVLVSVTPGGLLQSLKPQPQRTEVRAEPATRAKLIETVSAPGEIEPLTKVDISAEVSARIEQLPVRAGEEVQRDDIVVKLDDRNLKAEEPPKHARQTRGHKCDPQRAGPHGRQPRTRARRCRRRQF